jgi:hypothetical protein
MNIEIVKFKTRRGSDATRRQVVLDQGEIGSTTDTKRVFVGDGSTTGGVVVGNKIHPDVVNEIDLEGINAEIGDLARANGKVYRLAYSTYDDLSSWELFSQELDGLYITNTGGTLTIGASSVDGSRLNANALSSTSIALSSINGLNRLVVNYNTSTFTISSEQLALKTGGVNELHISSGALAPGLSGGSGNKIGIDVDGVTLGFTGNKLTVLSTPITALGVNNLGAGFTTTYVSGAPVVNTNITNIDSSFFTLCAGGVLTVAGSISSEQELPMFTVDTGGIIRGVQSSIFDLLSCEDLPENAPFVGSPDQTLSSFQAPFNQTIITVISSYANPTDPIVLTLSSAGFIAFEGNSVVRNGERVPGRFAIPVFTF